MSPNPKRALPRHPKRTWHQAHASDLTLGQRLADGLAQVLGS